ncbi:IS110 family transposase [Candidatus Oleimmundimicrobium sp.]|uniref:IS110 family transposase n=1 Tax=Candidatus Oleimmundimicrobium sp. TaxID=3060597 RepID=UPI0027203ECC|nr:IS110 family transposase [Candidatus Oleimmundimicrobium sp.]MDO8885282.1 IS110 family transposase [Candidatus Oleimmundimicrobium sp.]
MNDYNIFLGVDSHKKYCFVNVQDKEGNIVEEKVVKTEREALKEYFSQFKEDAIATVESTYNWMFTYDILKDYVGEVKLANPKQTKAISSAKVKTDKVDAKTLACLLRADLIPEIYVSTKKERDRKDILRHRFTLVKIRTSLKNKISAFMARYGFEVPLSDAFGVSGTRYVKNLDWKEPAKTIVFKYLEMIESLNREIKQLDKVIAETVKETNQMRLLQTIPGIGKITSYLIATEIGTIERFPSHKNLASYSGLVPGISSSAGKTCYKRSKDRNKYLQWALVEAAIPAVRKSPILLAKYTRIKGRKGSSKAKMAIARRLAEAVFKILTYSQEYKEGVTIQKARSQKTSSLSLA